VAQDAARRRGTTTSKPGAKVIQRILDSRNFVARLLVAATGVALYFRLPFPHGEYLSPTVALRAPLVHEGLFYSYNLLFTTPYIAYSILLSASVGTVRSSANRLRVV
jgi:hypothetical protein